MELGSKQHKQLLLKSILRTAFKTSSLGLIVGCLFLIPIWVRENSFSQGLAYLGVAIISVSIGFALWIAYQKYQRVIKTFDRDYNQS